MASAQSKEEREEKKRKAISGQTTLNHHTRATYKEIRWRNKSNDVAESRLQSLESATRTARRQCSSQHVRSTFLFFFA
jgi:hypothetical protein